MVESWAHLHKLAYEGQEASLIRAANEGPSGAHEVPVNARRKALLVSGWDELHFVTMEASDWLKAELICIN